MITKIGIVSGEILILLEKTKQPVFLETLYDRIDVSKDLIEMSVGWLTREGLIGLVKKEGNYLISKSNEKHYLHDLSKNAPYALQV